MTAQKEPPGGTGAPEPGDHGLGRSRGGYMTKSHLAVSQKQKPLSLTETAGQRGGSSQFIPVLDKIRVPRLRSGRPRTRLDRVLGDKAYGSRANRAYLRGRRIRCTIPEQKDRIASRKRMAAGPGSTDAETGVRMAVRDRFAGEGSADSGNSGEPGKPRTARTAAEPPRTACRPAAWRYGLPTGSVASSPESPVRSCSPPDHSSRVSAAVRPDRGVHAGFVVGDKVYVVLDLRKSARERGTVHVLAARSNYMVTPSSGRRLTAKNATSLVEPGMWQRLRTGSASKGARNYH